MKVCTDACILGAWTAAKVKGQSIRHILDIGCGTGLLSLMLAQVSVAMIDAVEINREAADQALENISISPWANRMKVIHRSVQGFHSSTKYDLVICNPPFFENDLKATMKEKNSAKHETDLNFDGLAAVIKGNLNEGGRAVVLLPYHRTDHFMGILEKNAFFVEEKLLIRHSPGHQWFRSILLFSARYGHETNLQELDIQDALAQYTNDFKSLLKDYYLGF